ncbi:enoyl-CoA hydratase/isomerase family protein [Ruixingdingia sedimenti]|uniref:Enoyl-CoA hydratase/isomerase family protein n=1 Tax=Ruixingdingia sedimenti TaxID=3073604 RepID=A0ABU1FAG4_9RHOB|nr:enoyl-CoA hydratase/isomerase family protein [Xinfangfangia sp. LG-4]MDR5653402.1 enoyl-CoA hydratase/isomerase family protein [Xinfangfangia sp. LG-4]
MSLIKTRDGDVLTLSLDRPEAGNRIDPALLAALTAEYEGARPLEGGPAVIVLTAEGPDFSLGRQRPERQSADPLDVVAEFSAIQRLNEAVQHCRAVTIAAVQGRCEGAGLSLAGRADIALMAEDARVGFPEIPHGIPPTIVLSHYRYVLPRNLLGDLIFTGRELTGAEAVGAGLAARAVPAADLLATAQAMAAEVAGHDRRSIALVKEFLKRTEGLPAPLAPALGISLYANEISHRILSKG